MSVNRYPMMVVIAPRKIMAVNRISQIAAETVNVEEGFAEQTAEKEGRNGGSGGGQNGDRSVFEHMAEQDGRFANALCACGAYIVLINLIEKKCPIQTDRRTKTADDADDGREHDEFPRLYSGMVARLRE